MVSMHDIIPPGWEEHHRAIVEAAMTAVCELREPSGEYDFDTGKQQPGQLIASNIACRVHPVSATRGGGPSARLEDQHEVEVIVPMDKLPELNITENGPIVTVTAYKQGHLGDPHLLGLPLRVTNLYVGTLQWERILTATTKV